ncbi:MAG: NTP/NDP exchange transporter [Myxococcota bacterium]
MNDRRRPPRDRSLIERFLGLFADVRRGEGPSAVLLAINVFVLLFAYYLIKTVREALVLTQAGAEQKIYLAAAISAVLVLYAKGFGALARRMNRIRLITAVTLFFASNLVVFYFLGRGGVSLGVAFFVWVGIFNVSVIAQFWSFANDLYTEEQGRRLFAIVAGGSTLGAVAGSYGAQTFYAVLGSYNLMLFTGGFLVASLALTWVIHRRHARSELASNEDGGDSGVPASDAVLGGASGAFQLVFRDRYLLLVGAITLIGTWVNTTGEYIFDRRLLETAREMVATGAAEGRTVEEIVGRYKGQFFMWVNILVVTLQFFAVSRILKYLGVRVALFVLPLVALGGYTAMMITPALMVIFGAKVAENGTDYSLQNTTRQTLFLVTSREAKYKAKALIDTFFFRLGDVTAAALVLLGSTLAFGIRAYIGTMMGVLALWVVVAALTARAHKARAPDAREHGTPS